MSMQRCSHGAGAVSDTSPRDVINAPTRTWLQHFAVGAAAWAAGLRTRHAYHHSCRGSRLRLQNERPNAGDTPIRISLRAGSATTVETRRLPILVGAIDLNRPGGSVNRRYQRN